MKVAIQGLRGSFHHEAAQKFLAGQDIELVECNTFVQVFDAVEGGNARYGVVAVENNLFGSINPVYGLLAAHDLWVAGDTTLHIDQFLIGCDDIPLSELHEGPVEVLSQVMAIAQCDRWLTEHLPQAVRTEMNDTTESVDTVVRLGDRRRVAIAGKAAAEARGGRIIAGPINDDPTNATRFFLLEKGGAEQPGAERTSLILQTDHAPGALYHALGAFVAENISLSKLDSHPIAGDTRRYSFYIDLDAPLSSAAVQRALGALAKQSCIVRVLGSYRVFA